MSETQGNDQNGGAIEESSEMDNEKVEILPTLSDTPAPSDSCKITMEDLNRIGDTDTQLDISSIKKISLENECQLLESTVNDNQATIEKINKSTNETDDTTAKSDKDETANQSRELKSLLALSKEARLDTNITRKRKSIGQRKKFKSECRTSTGKPLKIQYPVTAESELEMELQNSESNKAEIKDEESTSGSTTPKATKRKKISLSDASGDGGMEEAQKKNRKSLTNDVTLFKQHKDMFCWRCHKDGVNISCETCPRSYHHRCLKQTINDPNHWPCPECVSILKAESTQTRSPAMKGMTLENLCSLLKFAVNRMIQCQGSEPFIHPVNDSEFPDYKKYIIQPMDLTLLEKNIKENLYGSTQAFEADAKWILHNSIIFNSYQSKLTNVAKSIIKICKQEMAEIENCPSCYLNANTKKKTWFVEVCPKPHLLVWAKLRGFPFWPGKAMSCKDGMVDVRFFGAHDRAWVPEKECYLYCPKDPNAFRVKRADIEQCVEELNVHVENLKKIYTEFCFPPFKTPLDPENETKQLQIFLPRYKSYFIKNKSTKRQSIEMDKAEKKHKPELVNESVHKESKKSENEKKEPKKIELCSNEDEMMEGYGTDDETVPEIDTEMRKTLLKNSDRETHDVDDDDTQVLTNVVPDTSDIEEYVLTKARKISESAGCTKMVTMSRSEPSSKRPSFDDSSTLPINAIRRNSETRNESTRISDKISRVDISENMEISLVNDDKGTVGYSDNISSSNSECSSDSNLESKKKPVQIDVDDNAEFTISPASKLKIVDKLIKRLSDGDAPTPGSSTSNNTISDKIEHAKTNLNNEKLDKVPNISEAAAEFVHLTEQSIIESESSLPHSPSEDSVSSTNIELIESDKKATNEPNETNTQEKSTDDSQISTAHPKETALLNCIKKISEQDTEEIDDINIEELTNEDLDINDTKTELGTDANVDESCDSSDETSIDENKPLSDLAKPVSHQSNEDHIETVPKIKIILKTARTDKKHDNVKDQEDIQEIRRTTFVIKAPVKTPETCEKETEKSVKQSSETLAEPEILQNNENKESQSQKQTISVTLPTQEKTVETILIGATQEKENKNISNNGKDLCHESKSPRRENSSSFVEKSKSSEKDTSRPKSGDIDCNKSPTKVYQKERSIEKDIDEDELMDTMEEVDLNIDKANIINIIHSSLIDTSTTKSDESLKKSSENPKNIVSTTTDTKKRKITDENSSNPIESQNKMLKLVSIESIMNKVNNNQEDNQKKEDRPSLLKTTLQTKNIVRISSVQDSPNSSNRSSVHEISNDDIKSEPESEAESNTVQDLEAKKKYLSALNILEKGLADATKVKPNEIRTRSKTEERRERFRVVDNMTKIIEDVAVNYSAVHEGEALPASKKNAPPPTNGKPDGCEIFVKSFAKIVPSTPGSNNIIVPITKQRARKSFPQPNYAKPVIKPTFQPNAPKELTKIPSSTPITPNGNDINQKTIPKSTIATPSPVSTAVTTFTSHHIPKPPVPPLQSMEGVRTTNGYLILQPPQQENLLLLPPTQSINYTSPIANQMLSVTPCLLSAPTNNSNVHQLSQSPQWSPSQSVTAREFLNVSNSQNYIPQGEIGKNTQTPNSSGENNPTNGSKRLVNGLSEPAVMSSTLENSSNVLTLGTSASPTCTNVDRTENSSTVVPDRPQPEQETVTENGDNDEFGILNSLIPENVSRAVNEIIRRPPPKLKPRPPGALSQQFNEGIPSSAGSVTAKVNSVAHRLADYFRGMLIETLDDLGKTSNAEATIASLKLEAEALKHKHSIELSEIEKNMCTVLRDIQRSIVEDRERIIEETRAACEAETIKRVEEAKSKQWCANCSKEAQFYCCWNTSYCDYPCQQKHWPTHMNKCTQNINQPAQITPSSAIRPGGQQLILRPANPPPKGGLGRVFSKPIQKVYMNRNITAPKTMRVQTSTGNVLTMMETTPGNYQIMSSNSLIRAGSSVSNSKSSSLISVSTTGTASITAISQQKNNQSKQTARTLNHPIPITTALDEDSN